MDYKLVLRRLSTKYSFVYYLLVPIKAIYKWIWYRVVPEKIFLSRMFYIKMGYKLNLKNPKTLNEKIQWLKLYDRTDLHTVCADKFAVRKYIEEVLGDKCLIPLVFSTINVQDINSDNLPDYPLIIKTNHDSGCYFIIRDKKNIDWEQIRTMLKKSLNTNYYYYGKEWQYKNIKPRIVVEKLLMQSDGKIPYDYKIHCINGKVEMISVDTDRGTNKHCRNWYSPEWIRMPFKWSSLFMDGHKTEPSVEEVCRPMVLDDLIKYSEILSKAFYYVRIDWYEVEGVIYFGELTFHHDSGYRPIEPKEWDIKLGKKLKLPI